MSDLFERLLADDGLVDRCVQKTPSLRSDYSSVIAPERAGENMAAYCAIKDASGAERDEELHEKVLSRIAGIMSKYAGKDGVGRATNIRIANDCDIILLTSQLGLHIPYATATWLSYVAGILPTKAIEVDHRLNDVLDIGEHEALALLGLATRRHEGDLAAQKATKDAFFSRIAAAGEALPNPSLLQEILLSHPQAIDRLSESTTRVVTTVQGLSSNSAVPNEWCELLSNQRGKMLAGWEGLWAGFEKHLPPAFTFLRKHCCGVAVLERQGLKPALLYVYSVKSSVPCGFSYGAYIAGECLGESVPPALRDTYDRLPPLLQDFYSKVHNGWTQAPLYEYGPLPLDNIAPLTKYLDSTIPPPIPVGNLWEVMRVLGGARSLCLDVTTRDQQDPKAVLWFPSDKPKTDLSFWSEYTRWMQEGLEDMRPIPK